jgi:hypothetical protein
VTRVAELFFACVTLHAGEHQAFGILLAFDFEGAPVAGTNYFITPDIEQFHMLGSDFSSRQHTGFGIFG